MKTEQLGRITELPQAPTSEHISLLILENKEKDQYSLFKSQVYSQGNGVWIDAHAATFANDKLFKQEYPNGADAMLVSFE